MSKSISVVSTKIKDKGIFDMNELYKVVKRWLDFHQYGDESKTFKEELYVERIKGDSKQIEVRWKAERFSSDYFSNVVTITFLILGLKEVEIELDNKKIPTQKAELELRINAKLVKDRQDKWKSDTLRKIYDNTIVSKRIDEYWVKLYNEINGLINEIKAFLELRRA